ncbi:hypothetical protein NFI96_028387 [Prochilodus magdalenae]|nr:hypothetical protein NFI96_028387 [Prochilodus magdalenae]
MVTMSFTSSPCPLPVHHVLYQLTMSYTSSPCPLPAHHVLYQLTMSYTRSPCPLPIHHVLYQFTMSYTRLSWSDSEWQRVIFSDESRFSLGGDAQRTRVWRHRGQHQDGRFVVTRPEGLVSLHLHPYRTICRNCVRMFKLHGMDYHRTPSGTSTAPYRDVCFDSAYVPLIVHHRRSLSKGSGLIITACCSGTDCEERGLVLLQRRNLTTARLHQFAPTGHFIRDTPSVYRPPQSRYDVGGGSFSALQ